MRLNKTLLVASVALFVCIEASSVKSQLSSTTRVTPDRDHGKLRRNDANEERMLGIQNFFKGLKVNLDDYLLKLALDMLPPGDAYKLLKLHEVDSELFLNPQFKIWCNHVRRTVQEDPAVTIVRVLLDHLGDLKLVKLIAAARKVAETKALATELGDVLFKVWPTPLLPRSLFKRLELEAESDGLFRNPVFRVWCQLVQKKETNSQIADILLDSLDYLSLTTKILAAKKLEDTKDIAAQIYGGLLDQWKLREVPFGDLLTEILKIDLTNNNLLHDPLFNVWFDYAKRFDSEISKMDAVGALVSACGVPHIFKKLQTLTKGDGTEEVVTFLKEGQMRKWYFAHTDDLHVLNVFNPTSPNLFRDPMFDDWYKYMKMRSNKPDLIAVRTLLRRMDDRSLTKMLIDAANDDHTRDIALRFQSELINIWIEDKVPIAKLFQRLELKPTSDDIFDDPVFHAWCNYAISKLNDPNVVVAKDLSARLDDLSLAKMLVDVENDDHTSDIAFKLQHELTETWRRDQFPIAELSERLTLKSASDDLQHNPL